MDAIVEDNIVYVVLYLTVACYKIIRIIKYPTWIYDLYDIQQKTIQVVEKSMKVILLPCIMKPTFILELYNLKTTMPLLDGLCSVPPSRKR